MWAEIGVEQIRLIVKELRKKYYIVKSGIALIFIYHIFLWFGSSCANPGMPTGGPKDTLPPILLKSVPNFDELNYTKQQVVFTFDEFVNTSKIRDGLVISPPMKRKPGVKRRGKSVVIQLRDTLRPASTYSMDFRNTLVDNNENNPYENFRFRFSTGEIVDTGRCAGYVKDAASLGDMENVLLMFYTDTVDTTIYTIIPDFIAKTNEEGFFYTNNLPSDSSYYLFVCSDDNGNMLYEPGESFGWVDGKISPNGGLFTHADTVKNGDSVSISSHVHVENTYISLSEPYYWSQFLETNKRESANRIFFDFAEGVDSSFHMEILDFENPEIYVEYSNKRDSIDIWLLDTSISKVDSLYFALTYRAGNYLQDSIVSDTLLMKFEHKERRRGSEKRERRDDKDRDDKDRDDKDKDDTADDTKEMKDTIPPVENFKLSLSNTSNLDLNAKISVSHKDPLQSFDKSKVHLYSVEDSVRTEVAFAIDFVGVSKRKLVLTIDGGLWEDEQSYEVEIDSACAVDAYGRVSDNDLTKFTTQKLRFYGTYAVSMSGFRYPAILQLLNGDDKEGVVRELHLSEDGEVNFDYLKPAEYKLRLIEDENGDREWTTSSLNGELRQPESVYYYPAILDIKSNREHKESWVFDEDKRYFKPKKEEKKNDERGGRKR
ncbi:MAG: Ig-like domain-containing protein [Bacteroidales bacterium]